MDPNSTHQLWSKWLIGVRPSLPVLPAWRELRANLVAFLKSTGKFKSGTLVQIKQFPRGYVVELLTDTDLHPHDDSIVEYYRDSFERFFRNGLGASTRVFLKAKLMAGERLDGRPSDQMLILPRLEIPQRQPAGVR